METYTALLQRLEALHRAGVRTLPKGVAFAVEEASTVDVREQHPSLASHSQSVSASVPAPRPVESRTPSIATPSPTAAADSLIHVPFPANLPEDTASREAFLGELQQQVAACKLCKELACTRKQTVFGVGNVRPRVVFFGEAPGADEDRLGEPFVGAAGQLLDKIIKACTWERGDVYILNTLKCRPPGNRNPEPAEVANCRPFFEKQLEILRPEYIVCLGAVAAHALLENNDAVGKLRRNFHQYRGAKVVVTYHPSYLLRNPDAKRHVWDDMQKLLQDMGVQIPGKN